MDNQSCDNCQLWQAIKPDGDEGKCRLAPPRLIPLLLLADVRDAKRLSDDPTEDYQHVWDAVHSCTGWSQPITSSEDWCKKWQALKPIVQRLPTPEADAAWVPN